MKTLKDLKFDVVGQDSEEGCQYQTEETIKVLKAEAVKCLSYGIEDMKRPEQIADKIIKNFIDFFGWTEEDLK